MIVFKDITDMTNVPNPQSGFVFGYDVDGKLKQKDEYGVITEIGGSLTASNFNSTGGATAGYILSVDNSGVFNWVNPPVVERIDMASIGVPKTSSSQLIFVNGFLGINPNIWESKWKWCLWEFVSSNGTVLSTDNNYSSDIDSSSLVSDLDLYRNVANVGNEIEVVLRAYIYSNKSKEKVRIVGRNYGYWAMKQIQKYDNSPSRVTIVPGGTALTNIITYIRTIDPNVGAVSGWGVNFPSGKRNLYSSYYPLPGSGSLSYLFNTGHARTAISATGSQVLTTSLTGIVGFSADSEFMLSVDRDGIVSSIPTVMGNSILQLMKVTFNSDQGSYYLYLVKAIGQDTFMPSYTKLDNGENLFAFVEKKGRKEIMVLSMKNMLDNVGLGTSLLTISNKVKYNRLCSVWLSEFITKVSGPYGRNSARQLVKNDIKIKFAYGKNGTYTISNEFIYFARQRRTQSGLCIVALVDNNRPFHRR